MNNNIELILFDLDGVLVSTKDIHYECLNEALRLIDSYYEITESEHLSIFDGLKTFEKLNLLTKLKNLNPELHQQIWNLKQDLTLSRLENLQFDMHLYEIFSFLKRNKIKVGVCSNSIRKSVFTILSKIGIIEFMDIIISNQDVKNGKPHPEMYWNAMSSLSIVPENTLIVEDSPVGLLAARRSNAHILRVSNPKELTIEKIKKKLIINNTMKTKWQDDKLNILIPMAGAGSRFEKAGYTFPKPLIDVHGNPMIQVVVDNLNFDSKHIFIVQKSHRSKYNLDAMLSLISPKCSIIDVDGITEGAACTTLLAKEFINNDNPLIIANSDQFVEWNVSEFMYKMQENGVDAGILSFKSTHPKWSFVKVDGFDYVTEVAEKNPISNIATAGIYYWKKGSDYVKYAEQMIKNNTRYNNEFYVCPVFNEAIKDGKKVKIFNIEKMWGLGTPEDLSIFLAHQ